MANDHRRPGHPGSEPQYTSRAGAAMECPRLGEIGSPAAASTRPRTSSPPLGPAAIAAVALAALQLVVGLLSARDALWRLNAGADGHRFGRGRELRRQALDAGDDVGDLGIERCGPRRHRSAVQT
jgi:hypothetical protein